MKKDIYIISNSINNHQYIGQSVDYLYRFRKHKEASKRPYKYKSALYNAMQKYGTDVFSIQVLEQQIENYNEREQYWIKELNTLHPNGYNITNGGDWYPNLSGINHHSATIKTVEDLEYVYNELLNSNKTEAEIATTLNIPPTTISSINNGKTYVNPDFTYPLREFFLTPERLNRLTYDIRYSNYSYEELATLYSLSASQIKTIAFGRSWFREYLEYPLRKISFSGLGYDKDKIPQIQKDLLSTRLNLHEIANKYGASVSTIRRINEGTTYNSPEFNYPLKKERLTQEDINTIHSLLLENNISINQIAAQFNLSSSSIKNMNKGGTKKYYNPTLKYPLR